MLVKFSDDTIESFIKEKLLLSINDSLGHRNDHINEAISLTNTILAKLQSKYKTPMLEKNDIITTTEEVLKNFDKTAAVYYSAYHKIDS